MAALDRNSILLHCVFISSVFYGSQIATMLAACWAPARGRDVILMPYPGRF